MIQAHELCRTETVAPEVQIYYAGFGAGHIAQAPKRVAAVKDTCAELLRKIEVIRLREGLAADEFWVTQDEGPQGFRDRDEQFGRVLKRVADTIFVFALHRYYLKDQADLFERDRVAFEIQREIGLRVIMPVKTFAAGIRGIATVEMIAETEKMMDESFKRLYGTAAVRRTTLIPNPGRLERAMFPVPRTPASYRRAWRQRNSVEACCRRSTPQMRPGTPTRA
jgi:hypothetical protein